MNIQERFWLKALNKILSKLTKTEELKPSSEEKEMIATVYENMGGSWVDLAYGDVKSWDLLRKVVLSMVMLKKEKRDKNG